MLRCLTRATPYTMSMSMATSTTHPQMNANDGAPKWGLTSSVTLAEPTPSFLRLNTQVKMSESTSSNATTAASNPMAMVRSQRDMAAQMVRAPRCAP